MRNYIFVLLSAVVCRITAVHGTLGIGINGAASSSAPPSPPKPSPEPSKRTKRAFAEDDSPVPDPEPQREVAGTTLGTSADARGSAATSHHSTAGEQNGITEEQDEPKRTLEKEKAHLPVVFGFGVLGLGQFQEKMSWHGAVSDWKRGFHVLPADQFTAPVREDSFLAGNGSVQKASLSPPGQQSVASSSMFAAWRSPVEADDSEDENIMESDPLLPSSEDINMDDDVDYMDDGDSSDGGHKKRFSTAPRRRRKEPKHASSARSTVSTVSSTRCSTTSFNRGGSGCTSTSASTSSGTRGLLRDIFTPSPDAFARQTTVPGNHFGCGASTFEQRECGLLGGCSEVRGASSPWTRQKSAPAEVERNPDSDHQSSGDDAHQCPRKKNRPTTAAEEKLKRLPKELTGLWYDKVEVHHQSTESMKPIYPGKIVGKMLRYLHENSFECLCVVDAASEEIVACTRAWLLRAGIVWAEDVLGMGLRGRGDGQSSCLSSHEMDCSATGETAKKSSEKSSAEKSTPDAKSSGSNQFLAPRTKVSEENKDDLLHSDELPSSPAPGGKVPEKCSSDQESPVPRKIETVVCGPRKPSRRAVGLKEFLAKPDDVFEAGDPHRAGRGVGREVDPSGELGEVVTIEREKYEYLLNEFPLGGKIFAFCDQWNKERRRWYTADIRISRFIVRKRVAFRVEKRAGGETSEGPGEEGAERIFIDTVEGEDADAEEADEVQGTGFSHLCERGAAGATGTKGEETTPKGQKRGARDNNHKRELDSGASGAGPGGGHWNASPTSCAIVGGRCVGETPELDCDGRRDVAAQGATSTAGTNQQPPLRSETPAYIRYNESAADANLVETQPVAYLLVLESTQDQFGHGGDNCGWGGYGEAAGLSSEDDLNLDDLCGALTQKASLAEPRGGV